MISLLIVFAACSVWAIEKVYQAGSTIKIPIRFQPGFFAIHERTATLTEMGDSLVGLKEQIHGEAFRPILNVVYEKPRGSRAEAKPIDVVLMFKILVLQQLYNLSDDGIEYQVRDRLSSMRFLGLQIESRVPDAKAIWLFRGHLKALNLVEKLFEKFHQQLSAQGYVAKAGQMIDATFVEAQRQRNNREANAAIKSGKIPKEWCKDTNKLRQKDTDARWVKKNTGWTPETGTPQGAVLSPLLSNIYLDPLDHLMAQSGVNMVRYADDFVLLCRTEAEALLALAMVQRWTTQSGLTLSPTKTRIVDATVIGGFDFLGYHFERGMRWPRRKSEKKLRDAIRDKTRRTNGHSLLAIITDVNRTLKGWFEYFKHSHYTTFRPLDPWIRMRLRSVLRKRRGGRGRRRGADHQRWRNAFFAEQGLFSLVAAHAEASQSSCR